MKSKKIVLSVLIFASIIMTYYGNAQSSLFGVVTSIHDTLPIQNVTIKAIGLQTYLDETDEMGYFNISLESGNYNIQFILVGYDTISFDTVVNSTSSTEINRFMNRCPYPVPWVSATLSDDGESCIVDCGIPSGPYEIIYDDGNAEEFEIWDEPGGGCAVMVIAENYPAKLTGGRVFIGDGSFPSGNNIIGTQIRVGVVDNDGYMGLCKTILDSTTITVTNYGWLEFNNVFDLVIEDPVLIAVWQLNGYLDSAPIGVDTDPPLESYSYKKSPSGSYFNDNSEVDYMIRAIIDGPNPGFNYGKDFDKGMVNYTIARASFFDPCLGPHTGTLTPIAQTINFPVNNDVSGQSGAFAYGVKVNYDYGGSSMSYSNIVDRGNHTCNFNIRLCNGSSSDSVLITLINQDTCGNVQYKIDADDQGLGFQKNVRDGIYDIIIVPKYQPQHIIENVQIIGDTTILYEFLPDMFPPRNILIDTINNIVNWIPPEVVPKLTEDFEGDDFPPVGWSDFSACRIGWHQLGYDTAYPFVIPPGDGLFAVADNSQTNFNGCDNNFDYLMLPPVCLQENESYFLVFDYFFEPKSDQNAYVEYRFDQNMQWEVLDNLGQSSGWSKNVIDISAFSGEGSKIVQFAFHHEEYAFYLDTGIAIDNVEIIPGEPVIDGFQVSLGGLIIDTIPPEQTQYQFENLIDGQQYEACVTAIYECGVSEPICSQWHYYEAPQYTIPYFEGWDEKGYLLNDWTVTGTNENWTINMGEGNPASSVQFNGSPEILGSYSCSLTSPLILAENVEIGNVYFELDIKLETNSNSELDTLQIELFDGSYWHNIFDTIGIYDFEFSKLKFDVSNIVLGNNIYIRATASGMDSENIEGWYIDNISIYRECLQPTFLIGEESWDEYLEPSVKISWELPTGFESSSEWKHWDNSENFSGMSGDVAISAAVRWEPDQLKDYESMYLTKIRFFPFDSFTSWELRVWSGQDAVNLIYSQDVTESVVVGEWNEVILNEPVFIDNTKELWVGYKVDNTYGTYPAGIDKGPAIEGYGDMISYDENHWFRLSDEGWFNNWNIQAFIVETSYKANEKKLDLVDANSSQLFLSGFNIYRKQNDEEYTLHDQQDFIFGQENYVYFDKIPNVAVQNAYSYKVLANWQSDLDHCESKPALSKLNPDEDFVYVFLEDVPDNSSQYVMKVFPNPARDYVTIEANSHIKSVRILNLKGQTIMICDNLDSKTLEINTEDFGQGIYLIKVKAEENTYSEKLIITR